MRAQGELTMAQIARTLGVGRSTLYENLDLTAERAEQLAKAASTPAHLSAGSVAASPCPRFRRDGAPV